MLPWIVALSIAFVASHLVLSQRPIRGALIRAMGEWPFRGLYSLLALLTLGGAGVAQWREPHAGPVLWDLPLTLELACAVPLMALAFVLLPQALATPSPAGMAPVAVEARGVLRITRHPMNMALVCFGLAHALANGCLGDVAFFGAFVALGLIGSWHQDRRKAVELGQPFVELQRQTSLLPFVAILRGAARLRPRELKLLPLVLGGALFVAVLVLHGRFFGADLLSGWP
jgi:uncharacterized membrane protein